MPASGQSQTPAISTFQMDDSGVGNLKSSVNQFRGDVNFNQKLLSLPGRPGKKYLDVELTILCQSNVFEQASRWNLEAPTGVLGLGWTLPTERIVMQDNGSPSPAARTYAYEQNGSSNLLVREPQNPRLFTCDAVPLTDGQPIGDAVQSEFTDRGLAVDAGAIAEQIPGTDHWTIVDAVFQQLFTLETDGDQYVAYDGGESYQLQSYQFWKILYYPRFERWSIIKQTGVMSSYGGLGPSTDDGKVSLGHSIEWGVRWGYTQNGEDIGVWKGSSALVSYDGESPQQQYATAWRLESIADRWGDRVGYAYNETEVGGLSTGLDPASLQQPVGDAAGGLSYTKACYLTSITDVFGRQVVLRYGAKLYDTSSAEAPREYLDPHKDQPDTAPNGYQDRYETMFLDRLDVLSEAGDGLFSFEFEYAPRSGQGDASQVANVTQTTGALHGATFKRFLTGIVERNAVGESLPGLTFGYYLDPGDPNAGALASITYPQGATATYTYASDEAATELDICQRRIEIDPPPGVDLSQDPVPYLWFGPDYAVSLWLNTVKGILTLRTYTWIGRWAGWQYTDDAVIFSDSVNGLSDVEVIAQEGFFGLYFQSASQGRLYVFQKDTARPGLWQPMTQDGTVTVPLTYDLSQSNISLTGGNQFLAVLLKNTVQDTYSLTTYGYRWPTRDWNALCWSSDGWVPCADCADGCVIDNADVYLAAGAEYLATLLVDTSGNTGTLNLSHLDPVGQWHDAGEQTIDMSVPRTDQYEPVALAAGASLVAISVRYVPNAQNMDTDVYLVQWDEGYRFLPTFHRSFTDYVSSGGSLPSVVPQVIDNSLVGCAGHLLRYNGMLDAEGTPQWLVNDTLSQGLDADNGSQQHYAYGAEYGLQGVYQGVGTPVANCLLYDPNSDVTAWDRPPQALPVDNPNNDRLRQRSNWPSGGGDDFLTMGTRIYPRYGSDNAEFWSTGWQSLTSPPSAAGNDLSSESVVDEGPSFVCFLTEQDDGSYTDAQAFLLENGVVSEQQTLAGEKYWTASETSGTNVVEVGAGPAGSSALVTYPASAKTFEKASKVFLYRYAGNALEGDIVHYPVKTLMIDNGFGQTVETCYSFDTTTATCDPSGTVVKYYHSASYRGCGDPAQAQNGHTEYDFINGYENTADLATYPPSPDSGRWSMLDGVPLGKRLYRSGDPDTEVSRIENGWQVYTAVSASPTNDEPQNLYGGFAARSSETLTLDGVATRIDVSHVPEHLSVPFSGLPVQVSSSATNIAGEVETFTESMTYGYEVEEADYACGEIYRALNMLSTRTATTSWRSTAAADPVVASAKASTITPWPARVGSTQIQLPATSMSFAFASGSFEAFPYATWHPGDAPSGWQVTSTVRGRNAKGLTTETENAAGVFTSTLYGMADDYAVAQVSNASIEAGEATYLGFESYESLDGWTLAGGAERRENDANTGSQSLALPAGGTLSTTLTPGQAQPYVLSFFHKTAPGYAGGGGWTATVTSGGNPVGPPVEVPFGDTGGAWVEVSAGIPMDTATGDLDIELTAGQTTETVLLDDIRVAPLASQFQAIVYDPVSHMPTAQVDLGAGTQCSARDTFLRDAVVTTTGTDGGRQVSSILASFLSRQGNAGDTFDATSPNATVQVAPADGGTLETFRDGDSWKTRWQPGTPAEWQTVDGALQHTSASPDTLTWQVPGTASRGWAIYFELMPPSTLAGTCGFAFDGTSLQWNADTGAWEWLNGGTPVMAPLASPPSVGRTWLLVQGSATLAFFADGQLIFSQSRQPSASPQVQFFTGPNTLVLRNLTGASSPRLSLIYSDATGQSVQTQHLQGADALVDQTIYDATGQAIVQTKAAPASYGRGAGLPILPYRPDFVDVDAFLAVLDTTGVMPGDVAEYYSAANPEAPSDDEGYPYTRQRFEPSPLARVLEQGQAGKRYAIIDPESTPPESRPTTQFTYGANTADTLPDGPTLPANAFHVKTQISPAKVEKSQLLDTLKRQAAQWTHGGDISTQTTYASTFDASGRTQTIHLPNSYTTEPQADPQRFVITSVTNLLGQVVQTTDPDAGTVQNMYDSLGQLRFVQLAQTPPDLGGSCDAPAVQEGILYYKYDALGRQVESGTCDYAWTPDTAATLQSYADDPTWPSASSQPSVPYAISRTTTYDGDGNSPGALGQPTEVITRNPRQADGQPVTLTVTNRVSYLPNGRAETTQVSTDAAGAAGTQTVGYAYNHVGQVTELTYPENTLGSVVYGYDDLGQVTTVGDAVGSSSYGAYTYHPDGSVATEDLNGGAFRRTYTFEPPGWLATSALASSAHPAVSGSENYTYCVDGKVETYDRQITDGADSGPFQATYGYDSISRFQTATVASNPSLGSSVPSGQYDANGNIYSMTLGDGNSHLQMTYAEGFDLIHSVSLDGGADTPMCWDANGRVTTAPQVGAAASTTNTLSYDPGLGLTGGVQISGATSAEVTFAYGMKNQRTLKQVDGNGESSSRLYVHGPDGEVLAECAGDGTADAYVHGPRGLMAFQPAGSSGVHYPLADHIGSFYGVVRADGALVATYDYGAFGAVEASGVSPEILRYLFTGQELDEETGLYNYKARLYDPHLGRFYAPDPQHQFASPYVYAANDPVLFTDPSGEISSDAIWGFVISGAEIVAGVAVIALTEGSGSVVGVALIGAGVSGVVYTAENTDQEGKDFWSGWGKSEVLGAAGGLITGGIGFVGGTIAASMTSSLGKLAVSVGTGMIAGGASSVGTEALSIGLSQMGWGPEQSWSDLLSASSIIGDFVSVGLGAVGGLTSWGLRKKFPKERTWLSEDDVRTPQLYDTDSGGNYKYYRTGDRGAAYPDMETFFNDRMTATQNQLKSGRFLSRVGWKGKGAHFVSKGAKGRIPLLASPVAFNSKKVFNWIGDEDSQLAFLN